MKKILGIVIIVIFSFFSFTNRENIALVPINYGPKEVFEFRVHYGFITAGEAKIEVSDQMYYVNKKICYKATCTGRSSGSFDLVLRIRDTWVTYIDTTTKISQKSTRDIEEGKYKLKEVVQFNYAAKKAIVDWENKSKKKGRDEFPIVTGMQDIVSGAYYLRTIDFDKIKVNDIIELDAFFENKIFHMKIRYKGKEQIKTDYGRINALRLAPIMPDNGLFEGENSIRLWLSDDKNKLPLKIQADMFVGAVEVDLKAYRNLKYPITFTK
jgi:hypothetical protein